MIDNIDNNIKKLIKAINSNLIKAHQNEEDEQYRSMYLDLAGLYSCELAELLKDNKLESSRYFMVGADSFEKAGDIDIARMSYEKVIKIGFTTELVAKAKEGLARLK